MTSIGENISIKRKELGMTQEQLAQKLGYKSKSTINKIELGVNDIPQSKIVRFAEALQTTPAELMGWFESEPEDQAAFDAMLLRDSDLMEIMKKYVALSDKNKKAVKQMIDSLSE